MKKTKISFILFCLLAPYIVLYYLFLKIRDLKKIPGCCDGVGDCCKTDDKLATPRQTKILEHIRVSKKSTVPQLLKLFPGITDRTLRRDLNKMEEQGLVLRSGSTKSVSYTLK